MAKVRAGCCWIRKTTVTATNNVRARHRVYIGVTKLNAAEVHYIFTTGIAASRSTFMHSFTASAAGSSPAQRSAHSASNSVGREVRAAVRQYSSTGRLSTMVSPEASGKLPDRHSADESHRSGRGHYSHEIQPADENESGDCDADPQPSTGRRQARRRPSRAAGSNAT